MSDQMHALELHRVEEIEVVHGEIRHMPDALGIVGTAEARMLGNGERVFFRQPIEERQPARMSAGAMQEEERSSAAAAPDADGNIAHRIAGRCRSHGKGPSFPPEPRGAAVFSVEPTSAGRETCRYYSWRIVFRKIRRRPQRRMGVESPGSLSD